MRIANIIPWIDERFKRSRQPIAVGIVLLLAVSGGLFYLILTERIRRPSGPQSVVPDSTATSTTSTVSLMPRRLDGVLVPSGEEALMPRAVMVENMVDARPLSGPAKAQVVIEAPVEGGITRFMLLFDATTTVDEIGPVRSARPYFVEWAQGWRALYAHVGGSPEALTKISNTPNFANLDEMAHGNSFWRATTRYAPHNTYTRSQLLTEILDSGRLATSTAPVSWHTQDLASSTDRGDVRTISIPYGGSYNVTWKYDRDRGVYARSQAGRVQKDRDGAPVESENVIMIKTDSQVLDNVGRLRVRTVGSGDAFAYRDGKKFALRWQRAAGEPMRFEGNDGTEFLLSRGRTWIEVTTDDRIFAGLEVPSPSVK